MDERVRALKERIQEADSKIYMEGYDPTPALVDQLQRLCQHDDVDIIDGFITCRICGKQLKRYARG